MKETFNKEIFQEKVKSHFQIKNIIRETLLMDKDMEEVSMFLEMEHHIREILLKIKLVELVF